MGKHYPGAHTKKTTYKNRDVSLELSEKTALTLEQVRDL
jgi:hypothetical protein